MTIFTSQREKRLWLYALIVAAAILSTLTFGRPLREMLVDQNVQAVFFLLGMVLTAATIIVYGLKLQPGKAELTVWLGLATVYIMLVFRLGAPERSHLIEYSVLAIFIHQPLIERLSIKHHFLIPALLAFLITTAIGVIDESVQLFLPDRVFSGEDIFFNGSAAFMAITTSLILRWLRKKFRKQDQ